MLNCKENVTLSPVISDDAALISHPQITDNLSNKRPSVKCSTDLSVQLPAPNTSAKVIVSLSLRYCYLSYKKLTFSHAPGRPAGVVGVYWVIHSFTIVRRAFSNSKMRQHLPSTNYLNMPFSKWTFHIDGAFVSGKRDIKIGTFSFQQYYN